MHLLVFAIFLGLGTTMVYPTFLVSKADLTHPRDRANSMGAFRFWRDLGYAIGALLTGQIADNWNLSYAILLVGFITLASAFIIKIWVQKIY